MALLCLVRSKLCPILGNYLCGPELEQACQSHLQVLRNQLQMVPETVDMCQLIPCIVLLECPASDQEARLDAMLSFTEGQLREMARALLLAANSDLGRRLAMA